MEERLIPIRHTETDNVEVQRLRDLKKTYELVVKTTSQTIKMLDELPDTMGQCLDSLRMKLEVPVSETQAEHAYHALLDELARLKEAFVPLLTTLTTALKTQVSKQREVLTECDVQYKVVQDLKILNDGEMKTYPTLYKGTASIRSAECRSRYIESIFFNRMKVELDNQVRKLREGQSKEIQQKLQVCHEPQQLLLGKVKLKPVLMLETRPSQGSVPPEIIVMIYSLCDLETCYDLRQVNSTWNYGFLQVPETTWKNKLRYRNPWMIPHDGELTSYAECVLKFVGRLKTWIPVQSVDDMEIPTETPKSLDCIIAEPLEKHEKLPESFEPMLDKYPGQCHHWCEHIHGRSRFLDLTTLEYVRNPVIENDPGTKQVSTGPSGTVVHTYDRRATLFPRSSSFIEFDHQNILGRRDDFIHLQDVFIARDVPSGTRPPTFSYSMVDLQNRQMVHFTESAWLFPRMPNMLTSPVASYNGLVWWALERRCMVPTFLDLQQPGKIYHNPNKAINGPELFNPYQGSRSSHSERFVVGNAVTTGETHIYDLETGQVTAVLGTKDCYHSDIFMGYEEGHFKPRCVSEGHTDEYLEELDMEFT